MRKVFLILDVIAFVASLIWAMTKPDYEPFIAVVTSLGVLLAILFTKPKKSPGDNGNTIFNQRAGDKSTQYQAKGDINIKK